jgi:hypothetical protein
MIYLLMKGKGLSDAQPKRPEAFPSKRKKGTLEKWMKILHGQRHP